ncbi:glycoside hydrolase family 88 protein [Karstenula rhodostoma CBS 690.94]|uniref:Glycoside hydrolase family 88 protein n=1 Tax=Karstenula rhodostoma CBS 690.94 TaxID=1392251 RepID=A0A9P4UDJ8_9PLEO|nr:glycoside hydrolase family 88 protein [Karstenula rhodostoma CBS 690.94]
MTLPYAFTNSSDEDNGGADSSPPTSATPSEADSPDTSYVPILLTPELFAENITAKVLRTAQTALKALPDFFPEYVLQDPGCDGRYTLREADFWTCGFFSGTLYTILERAVRFPQSLQLPPEINALQFHEQLLILCRAWAEPLYAMDQRTDTHDIGFIIMPALQMDWELFGNRGSLDSIVRAARSLATRYVPSARAIRSWDLLKKKDIEILDQEHNMIVIIDSMCNLDLMYYASHHMQEPALAEMATAHAETLLRSHLRPEKVVLSDKSKVSYTGPWYSTCHVANINPKTGTLKRRLTAQGYAHESNWARGQAWGILGYAQTYLATKDQRFLHASCGLAEYFLQRLETSPACVTSGRHVPLWDFDAPIDDKNNIIRDSSAGVIAANGMLILSQVLAGSGQGLLASRFREAALVIVQDTISFALAPEKAKLACASNGHIRAEDSTPGSTFEGLLKYGTANNNEQARKRYANHGLVYGDYYLAQFGNRLMKMGLV